MSFLNAFSRRHPARESDRTAASYQSRPPGIGSGRRRLSVLDYRDTADWPRPAHARRQKALGSCRRNASSVILAFRLIK